MSEKIIEIENKPIYVVGDIHGNFETFAYEVCRRLENCHVIVAGDCGFGFYHFNYYVNMLNQLQKKFEKKNINVWFLRGNHDNPKYFVEHLVATENIKLIDDYTVLSTEEDNILCVGGGVSIDRKYRKMEDERNYSIALYNSKGYSRPEDVKKSICLTYWEDEMPYYDEDAITKIEDRGINITHVVTHTSPSFCYKIEKDGIKGWIKRDKDLENDLKYEREQLSKLYNRLTEEGKHSVFTWTYGHFHGHCQEKVNNTMFTALFNIESSFDCIELTKFKEFE